MMLGATHLRLNNLDEAQKSFEKAHALSPNFPGVNFYLGVVFNQRHDHENAIKYLLTAIEEDPDNASAMGTLASVYDEAGRHAASDSLYERALQLEPENATLLNNYAYSLSERGIRLDEALTMVKKALEKEPRNGAFIDTIGWIYYKLGHYETALTHLLDAVSVRETSAEVMEHVGDVYEKLGQINSARKYWQKALELEGDRKSVLQKLGQPTN